jgi:hypothetical protein
VLPLLRHCLYWKLCGRSGSVMSCAIGPYEYSFCDLSLCHCSVRRIPGYQGPIWFNPKQWSAAARGGAVAKGRTEKGSTYEDPFDMKPEHGKTRSAARTKADAQKLAELWKVRLSSGTRHQRSLAFVGNQQYSAHIATDSKARP